MRIIYNGIDLFCLETHEYSMEPVYDDTGTDYLYTKHAISVRAVVNGQAEVFNTVPTPEGGFTRNGPPISYNLSKGREGPVGGPTPGGSPPGSSIRSDAPAVGPADTIISGTTYRKASGLDAVGESMPGRLEPLLGVTDSTPALSAGNTNRLFVVVATPGVPTTTTFGAIRHRLTTPRGRLFIFSGPGNETPGAPAVPLMLMSPAIDVRCDCKNGPFPRVLSTPQVFGDATTFLIDFSIETYVNESVQNGVTNPGVLLSNRFGQTHTVKDGWTTVETHGTVILRTDLVYDQEISPDAYRPNYFLPIAQGFVREDIIVEAIPDVTGVHYSYTDRQVPVNFTAGPYVKAAKISAVHRQSITGGTNILTGALTTYERVLGALANKNFAFPKAEAPTKPPGTSRSRILQGAKSFRGRGRPYPTTPSPPP